LLLGGDITGFTLDPSHFDGFIAGTPCQDFSRARRQPPSGLGLRMLEQFCRLVTEGEPDWWLLENVPSVPNVIIKGYTVQRFNMFASDFGLHQRRNRTFQFGSRGQSLLIPRVSLSHTTRASRIPTAGQPPARTNFADYCELMGLPRSFNLPGLSRSAKYRAVRNGVPVPMAHAVAAAIRDRHDPRGDVQLCPCHCGRPLTGQQQSATVACRKRLQRQRELNAAASPPTVGSDRPITRTQLSRRFTP
jgi:DNA (cytosine-5)-methyltransferase 1